MLQKFLRRPRGHMKGQISNAGPQAHIVGKKSCGQDLGALISTSQAEVFATGFFHAKISGQNGSYNRGRFGLVIRLVAPRRQPACRLAPLWATRSVRGTRTVRADLGPVCADRSKLMLSPAKRSHSSLQARFSWTHQLSLRLPPGI